MAPRIAVTAPQRLIAAESGFDAKLAFLSKAQQYPEATASVEPVETHMSWVFLTDHYAYKIKKPIHNADVDLRTVSARQCNCAEEVRLNRRLSSDVYLGTVALYSNPLGALTFDDGDAIVDWLVKMRRLPADRMLDRQIRQRSVARGDIDALIGRLWNFYRSCPPIGVIASEYRVQFRDNIISSRAELGEPQYGIACPLIDRIARTQLAMLANSGGLFDARVRDGRIVEGHGDLRPEHICLEADAQIIDCLEFSRVLRTLDVVDELGYLALECERLGAPDLRGRLFESYRNHSGDCAPDALVHFYQSYRACVRATLALRHLREPGLAKRAVWRTRALEYLDLAQAHADHCG
jgi:aminoglycoside phosphotransferase family enzyme